MANNQQDTFETFIERERARLQKERDSLMEKQSEIQHQLAAIHKEMEAIQAYENAKKGKPASSGQRRARRGKRQEQVLSALQQFPQGATRGELLEAMNAKGDKSAEQSVSNALNKMKKDGKLTQVEGRYLPTGA
jgi:O6-methylguanine-DNA--protein-cysteine methyltransferase